MTSTALERGAANAVRVCMGVGAGDRVVVVTDRQRENIGRALAEEAGVISGRVGLLMLEDYLQRPADRYPEEMRREISELAPTVSFFAAAALPGELAFRQPYMDHVIYGLGTRHAHMVGIDDRLMAEGMQADYREVARITGLVTEAVRGARTIEVESPSGTHMIARFDPSVRRWNPCPGLYHQQRTWATSPRGRRSPARCRWTGSWGPRFSGTTSPPSTACSPPRRCSTSRRAG